MAMKLFEPIMIRGMELKNRIVMAPMHLNLGLTGRRARAFYAERAKGGVGTIVFPATTPDLWISDEAWGGKKENRASFVERFSALVDSIHQYGAKFGLQLWHGNMFPAGMWGGYGLGTEEIVGDWVAPSARENMRELSIKEIKAIIEKFALASAKVKEIGCDFVELNAAHSYLLNQFFSPIYNHRSDDYGGDLSRRMRFGVECVNAVREAVGEDYPIFIRLGAHEFRRPNGVTIDDSALYAVELEKAGVDVLSVSVADPFPYISPLGDSPAGTYIPLAEAIKRKVGVYVMGVGRIDSPEVAETFLSNHKVDLIGIGRQLIADPFWPEKVKKGESDEIIPCLSCNGCVDAVFVAKTAIRCAVNPSAGKESDFEIKPAEKPKRVFVIGGGPSGMEAASIAAKRGHEVTLFEKENDLGGQLLIAIIPPYKQEIEKLMKYLVRQVGKSSVKVKLSEEVNAKFIEEENPDAVIIATGPLPFIPDIPGIERNNVVLAEDVLHGRKEAGKRVVIIGGELVGCETAEFLADRGRKVTVVRRGAEMAAKVGPTQRDRLLRRLTEKGVTLSPGVKKYEQITGKGLVLINREGRRQTLEADTIVVAAGARTNIGLAKDLEGKVAAVYTVGDCAEPRNIMEAISEGAKAGIEV